jgi:hypothetical protein
MSKSDTMTPLLSMPWIDASGKSLAVRSLPGLRPELIKTLKSTYPGIINPSIQALLATCCGLADTDLGHIDFTGCSFPEEPCSVFQPCLTLAIDDAGRRWIAEVGNKGLPGPVWCVFPDPQVAVHISDDLPAFLATLHEHAHRGRTLAWLQELSASAHAIWAHRRALALRPYRANDSDEEIRSWLSGLPADAYVYDLRRPSSVRGWPYGVAGPSARLYRCGRLPVFAVAGSPAEGWRAGQPETTSPVHPFAAQSMEMEFPARLASRRAAAKRVSDRQRKNRWAGGHSRRMAATIALCGVAMPSLAGDLVQTLPHLWVSAAALSLTLVSAANRPKN